MTRRGPGGGEVASATTDGSGWFGLVDLEPGRYQVRVEGEGVTGPRNRVVVVNARELGDVNFSVRTR